MRFEKEKREACKLAKALMSNNDDYLDNVVNLFYIGNKIHQDSWQTEFHIFSVIETETDHLPLKRVRELCSNDFLKKSDLELARIIKNYSKEVEIACKDILSKYGNV
jgi:hypothetical protein